MKKKIKQFTLNIKFDSTFIHSAQMNDAQNFKVMLDSNICRVDIPSIEIPEAPFPEIAAIEPLIEQATNNIHFYAYKIPKIEKSKSGLKIEYFNDDSVYSYVVNDNSLNFDSLNRVNEGMDLYNLSNKFNPVKPSDDTMLIKYQFNRNYYHKYSSDDEFKKEMEKLQNELKQLSEELKSKKSGFIQRLQKAPESKIKPVDAAGLIF
ncbi:MAG: hypothetical protein M5T52_22170 [Ignavibacteriaceae bacterium]|nr:hypothetical protein [Ignavibacteriaceae bacterium]